MSRGMSAQQRGTARHFIINLGYNHSGTQWGHPVSGHHHCRTSWGHILLWNSRDHHYSGRKNSSVQIVTKLSQLNGNLSVTDEFILEKNLLRVNFVLIVLLRNQSYKLTCVLTQAKSSPVHTVHSVAHRE